MYVSCTNNSQQQTTKTKTKTITAMNAKQYETNKTLKDTTNNQQFTTAEIVVIGITVIMHIILSLLIRIITIDNVTLLLWK
jgi:hypothetical protein